MMQIHRWLVPDCHLWIRVAVDLILGKLVQILNERLIHHRLISLVLKVPSCGALIAVWLLDHNDLALIVSVHHRLVQALVSLFFIRISFSKNLVLNWIFFHNLGLTDFFGKIFVLSSRLWLGNWFVGLFQGDRFGGLFFWLFTNVELGRFLFHHVRYMAKAHSRVKIIHWRRLLMNEHWLRKVLKVLGSKSWCCLILTNYGRLIWKDLRLWLLHFLSQWPEVHCEAKLKTLF